MAGRTAKQKENMKPFALRLTDRMESKKVTNKALGEVLGIAPQAISQYRQGSREPNLDSLVKIASFLGTSTDYLLGIVDDPDPDPEIVKMAEFTGLTPEALHVLHEFIDLYYEDGEGHKVNFGDHWLADLMSDLIISHNEIPIALYNYAYSGSSADICRFSISKTERRGQQKRHSELLASIPGDKVMIYSETTKQMITPQLLEDINFLNLQKVLMSYRKAKQEEDQNTKEV